MDTETIRTISGCFGKHFCIVTPVKVGGSLPTPKHGRMLCDINGRIAGTVGGGALEGYIVSTCKKIIEKKIDFPILQTIALTNNKANNLGMICGGKATLLIEPLLPTTDPSLFESSERCEQHKLETATILNSVQLMVQQLTGTYETEAKEEQGKKQLRHCFETMKITQCEKNVDSLISALADSDGSYYARPIPVTVERLTTVFGRDNDPESSSHNPAKLVHSIGSLGKWKCCQTSSSSSQVPSSSTLPSSEGLIPLDAVMESCLADHFNDDLFGDIAVSVLVSSTTHECAETPKKGGKGSLASLLVPPSSCCPSTFGAPPPPVPPSDPSSFDHITFNTTEASSSSSPSSSASPSSSPSSPSSSQSPSDSQLVHFAPFIFVNSVFPLPRLLIFGGGHCGHAMYQVAKIAGFCVSVFDDREEFCNKERFPEADSCRVIDFKKDLPTIVIDTETFIVAMTRGHSFDYDVVKHALPLRPKYIGMIGSIAKCTNTYRRLMSEGISYSLLNSLFAPIGLRTGGSAPGEIAISVMSQILMVKYRQGIDWQDDWKKRIEELEKVKEQDHVCCECCDDISAILRSHPMAMSLPLDDFKHTK